MPSYRERVFERRRSPSPEGLATPGEPSGGGGAALRTNFSAASLECSWVLEKRSSYRTSECRYEARGTLLNWPVFSGPLHIDEL